MVARALFLLVAVVASCCLCDSTQLKFMKLAEEKFESHPYRPSGIQKDIVQLGTSLPPVNSEDLNLTIAVGNKVELGFNFDNVVLVDGVLPSASLWLFPNASSNEGKIPQEKDVVFTVTARCPRKQYGTTHHVTLKWNPTVSCLSLDVTIAIKRLLKFLGQSQERLITLTVEVAEISEHSPTVAADGDQKTCSTLLDQSTDAIVPFLFLQFVEFDAAGTDDGITRNRRSNLTSSPPGLRPNVTTCRRIEQVVNTSFAHPAEVDIGECVGECVYQPNMYSILAQIEQQQTMSCTPQYKPLTVLILPGDGSGRAMILSLQDAVIESCKCVSCGCQ